MKPDKPENRSSEFEAELEALKREYSALERHEPPDLLDRAVLNAARRELAGGSRWASLFGPRRAPRWIGGIATAAVVVLAITVMLERREIEPALPDAASFEQDREPKSELGQELQGAGRRERRPDESGASIPETPGEDRELYRHSRAASTESESRTVSPNAPEPVSEAAETQPKDKNDSVLRDGASAAGKVETEWESPEAWIKHLLDLEQSGEEDRLRAEIRAFRATYPDHPLPASLDLRPRD